MKKTFFSLILLMITILSGCEKTEIIKETITQEKEIIIDYSSSTSFEKSINDKKEVKNKIIKVLINEVEENNKTITKFKSGNNLIFISNENININKNDYMVLKVIKEPVKRDANLEIEFEMIKVIKNELKVENEDNNKEETKEDSVIENKKIKMDKDSSNYVGLDKNEIEKEFKNKGFQNIEFEEIKTTDSNNKDNSIISININEKEFKKNEEFNKEDKIVIVYYKYEKPVSEYELAFIRDMSNYDLYFMFDKDTKEVAYFGTNDSGVMKTKYTGNFSKGVDIDWDNYQEGWHDTFIYKDGSTVATYIDGNGFEWEYKKCDLKKAQSVLDSLK